MTAKSHLEELSKGINDFSLKIAVIGMGYVGLPTAIAFHNAGFSVVGIDNSKQKLESIESGSSPITDELSLEIPSGERWTISSSYSDHIPSCSVAVICVPTPVNKSLEPNLSYVISAISEIIETKNQDQNIAIVMESTVHPGTTMQCLSEIIGNRHPSSLGISIAYCPERVSPGEGGRGVSEVPRVIGSESPELTEVISSLYGSITSGGIHPVSSIEVAEASKLVENAQRDIDIAFINELAILLPKMGLDVEEVLDAASSKWNFHRHTPGLGVGGHCIPVDPHYYIEFAKKFGVASALSPAARALNSSMPEHSAREMAKLCEGSPKKILVLGYSYKPNVSDTRETPVKPFIESVIDGGTSEVFIWDEWVENNHVTELATIISDPYSLTEIDCIVIGTAHDEIVNLDWEKMKKIMNLPRIYDSRRCLNPENMEKIGWTFHAIGRPI